MLDCICFCEAADSYTLKRLRNSSSTTVSPRLPMKRVLQGGLSFVFCRRKFECPIRRCSKKNPERVCTSQAASTVTERLLLYTKGCLFQLFDTFMD
jgi:hypothetical protein